MHRLTLYYILAEGQAQPGKARWAHAASWPASQSACKIASQWVGVIERV